MKRKITNPLIPFEDKWVALSPNRKRVVVSGATVQQVEKKLARLGDHNSVLMKVLPFDRFYSP